LRLTPGQLVLDSDILGGMMAEKKFEEAMEDLEKIVEKLEGGELPLEDSIRSFEEGMKLIKFCSSKLEEAEKKITLLSKENNGKYSEVPFEPESQEEPS
jgi:exodeoxyribonuclease VII small subunit